MLWYKYKGRPTSRVSHTDFPRLDAPFRLPHISR
jgi:hypothetical protein